MTIKCPQCQCYTTTVYIGPRRWIHCSSCGFGCRLKEVQYYLEMSKQPSPIVYHT